MVVDDDPDFRGAMKAILEPQGIEVSHEAGTGEECLALLKENRIALIFLDIMMPGMDGLETLRRILKSDPGVRVIMMTGVDDGWVCENCLAAGAKDYITKGKDPIQLAEEVAKALKGL